MKKGQITLFMLLGIVILIIIGLLFFFRAQILQGLLGNQLQKTETVPEQLRPAKDSFDNCVSQIGGNGLSIIGLQGGYITIPKDNMPRGFLNQFSNSLEVISNINTAYWFYATSNGIQKINVPTKDQMKNDLNQYVKDNVDACISDQITSLSNEGFTINKKGDIKVTSNIQYQYVELSVEYPIDVQYKGTGKTLTNYYAKINYPLGEFYDSSIDILNNENKQYYFENKTMDILEVYEDVPFAGQSLDCVPKVWYTDNIEQKLKSYLRTNIGAVKVKGTIDAPVDNYYNMPIDKPKTDLETNFLYTENWPLELSINGGEKILREETIIGGSNPATKMLAGLTCLNSYQFIYDIKYPILVQLKKNNYIFQYATQIIIKNNQPREN